MRKSVLAGTALLMLGAVLLAGCTGKNTVMQTDTGTEAETQLQTDTRIVYVTEQEKNSLPDEPVGFLKDHLTGTGSLGKEYPFLSGYGPRDDFNGQISSFHRGMDFGMEEGTQLTAPGKCTVSYTGYTDQRGNWIVLYWGKGYYLVLQHLSKIFVKQGDTVLKGQVVALSGDTGASITPHLHLEIIQDENGGDTITDFNTDLNRINPYYFVFGLE